MGSKRDLPLGGEQRKESAAGCSSHEDIECLRREVADLRQAVQELSSMIRQLLPTRISIINANGDADWAKVEETAYAFLGSAGPEEGYKAGTLYIVTDKGAFPTLYRSIRGLKKALDDRFFSPHQGFLVNRERMGPLALDELLRAQGVGYVRVGVGSEYKRIPLSRRGRARLKRLWKETGSGRL